MVSIKGTALTNERQMWGKLVGCILLFLLVPLAGLCASCTRHPVPKETVTQKALKERIAALNHESMGTSSLGIGHAYPTENTEFIIAHKDEAIPLLVDALKDENELIKVGYVAYILRRLNLAEGKSVAAKLQKKLAAKGPNATVEERFAWRELTDYLEP